MTAESKFDFALHEQTAVSDYLKVRPFYGDLCAVMKRIIEDILKRRVIQVHSVEARAKDAMSFGKKAGKPSDTDPEKPKYPAPLTDITDLAGIRIITFFPKTLVAIDEMLSDEFVILDRIDKEEKLIQEETFGYKSVHYLLKLNSTRIQLPEYNKYRDATAEVQVRTILQHAWAEIEHDIQYKSSAAIPKDIRRRFIALAGLLEIADKEFQEIQDDDRALTNKLTNLVIQGDLDNVEIFPASLKTYLDKKLGPDGRVSDWSYDWTVRLLKKLGFQTLRQIDDCIKNYDDDKVSKIIRGNRQGQTTRFEFLLLAGMGERYIQRHIYADEPWYGEWPRRCVEKLSANGVSIGDYDPISRNR